MNSVLASSLAEEDLLAMVIDRARARGWLAFHPRPARTDLGWRTAGSGDVVGFPDLVLARDGVVIFAELKSARGRLTDSQKAWLDATGGQVWRPRDWGAVCTLIDLESHEDASDSPGNHKRVTLEPGGPE